MNASLTSNNHENNDLKAESPTNIVEIANSIENDTQNSGIQKIRPSKQEKKEKKREAQRKLFELKKIQKKTNKKEKQLEIAPKEDFAKNDDHHEHSSSWKDKRTQAQKILSATFYGDLLDATDPKLFNLPHLNLLEKTPHFITELIKDKICVCFDCDFEDLMKDSEIESAVQQIIYAYGDNSRIRLANLENEQDKLPFFFSVTGLKMRKNSTISSKRMEVLEKLRNLQIPEEKLKALFEINDEKDEKIETEIAGEIDQKGGSMFDRLYNRLGCENWFIDFSENQFFEHFEEQFRNGDIIYLTADVPDKNQENLPKSEGLQMYNYEKINERLEKGKVYVIGGLVDRNRYKCVCFNKVKEINQKFCSAQEKIIEEGEKLRNYIFCAKLPICQHIKMQQHILTINQCFELLKSFADLGFDWSKVFKETEAIPTRKIKEFLS